MQGGGHLAAEQAEPIPEPPQRRGQEHQPGQPAEREGRVGRPLDRIDAGHRYPEEQAGRPVEREGEEGRLGMAEPQLVA